MARAFIQELKTAPTFIELSDAGIRIAGHGEFPPERGNGQSFITDALKVIHTDQIVFELKGPTKPGMIRAGNDFTYVLMPVSLN